MKITRTIIIAILVIFIGFLIYKASESSIDYNKTVTTQYRDITKVLTISGIVQPAKDFEIKSTISGVMEKLYVKVGDFVNYGDPIAKVQMVKSPEEYQELLKQMEVTKIKKGLAMAKNERTKTLFEKGFVCKEEYEGVLSDYNVLQSEYDAIISELNMLKGKYGFVGNSNIITATNRGTVLELPVKEGGSVMARGSFSEGSTIAKIAELKTLVFKSDVIESDAIKLHVGMRMYYTLVADNDIQVTGDILSIDPMGVIVDGVSRFKVVSSINIPVQYRNFVRAGCSINAKIVLSHKKHVLALEEKYFQFNYDSVFVEVKNKNGNYQKRYLHTGISDGNFTEILSGLKPKEQIKVINGTDRKQNGI